MSDFDAKRARAKRPMPLWVDAFKRDTGHFEADEIGAYFNLLMAMWSSRDLCLPDDPKRLARAAGVSVRLWNSRVSEVILPMLSAESGTVSQERLRKEATYVERQVQQQHDRKVGKKHDKPLKTNKPPETVDVSTDQSTVNPSQQPNNPTIKEEGKPSSKKRRTSIPEDAVISDRMIVAACDKRGHPLDEAEAQFAAFKNDALAKGKTFVDWDRAFITWLDSPYFRLLTQSDLFPGGRNAAGNHSTQRNTGGTSTGPRGQGSGMVDAFAAVAAERYGSKGYSH